LNDHQVNNDTPEHVADTPEIAQLIRDRGASLSLTLSSNHSCSLYLSLRLLIGIDSIIEPLDVVLGCLLFDDDLAVALAID